MDRRRLGRFDRFDLQRALILWRKQVLGMRLAKLDEINQRSSQKLLASRREQLARSQELDSMARNYDSLAQRKRPLEASTQVLRQHLRGSLDSMIESAAEGYMMKYLKKHAEVAQVEEDQPGDLCTSVTVLLGKDELVVNLSEGLTFTQLLDLSLEYWDLATGGSASTYHLVEDSTGHVKWGAHGTGLNTKEVVYISPGENVKDYFSELDEETRVRVVRATMPGFDSLLKFQPAKCFNYIRKTVQSVKKEEEDICSRYVMPHVWSLAWILVIVMLAIAVMAEVNMETAFRLHLAIEEPAIQLTYESLTFDRISDSSGAIKYVLQNAVHFMNMNSRDSRDLSQATARNNSEPDWLRLTTQDFRAKHLSMDQFMILRQHRSSTSSSCCSLPDFAGPEAACYCPYDLTNRDKSDFGLEKMFEYFADGMRSKTTYIGRMATYDSSGAYVMINNTVTRNDTQPGIEKDLSDLLQNGFFDEHTRAVIVKTRFVNKNRGVLATQILLFEFGLDGFVTPDYIFVTQPLKGGPEFEWYVALFYFNVALNVCSGVLLFFDARARMSEAKLFALALKKAAVKHGSEVPESALRASRRGMVGTICHGQYLKQQMSVNLLLVMSMILKIVVINKTEDVDTVIASQRYTGQTSDWPVDQVWVAMMINVAILMDSFSLFLTMGVLLDKLRIFASFWVLVRTIEISASPFYAIGGVLCIYCCLFSLVATSLFGTHDIEYSTFSRSLLVMLRIMLGQYIEEDKYDPLVGLFFMIAFVFPLFWMYCSVFFAVLLDAYWVAVEDFEDLKEKRHEQVMQLQIFQLIAMYTKVQEKRSSEKISFVDVTDNMYLTIVDKTEDDDDDSGSESDDNVPPDADESSATPTFEMVSTGDGHFSLSTVEKAKPPPT